MLIVTFFVTSSDSGSLVIDMLASGGNTNPPIWSRVFWAVLEGAVAAALLIVGSVMGAGGAGLGALQTTAIIIALPFSFVMILLMVATLRAFRHEWHVIDERRRQRSTEQLAGDVAAIHRDGAADGGSREPAGR